MAQSFRIMRRVRHTLLALLAALLPLAAAGAPLANQLKDHPSPYLALHGADPVAWQEWNAATVARARAEGKLLYLSIGYFSCHWCHVMQRESYRNADIARLLNARFIPVKVDRELEPALDQRLIDFAAATRGMSGWPLNVFVTPDGHPLYATLYHPPQEFLAVLKRVDELWRTDRARLRELARLETSPPAGPGKPEVQAARVRQLAAAATDEALRRADGIEGGFGEQGKFPQAPQLAFLLARHEQKPEPRLRKFLELTFDAMAGNGLHDHIGGGFFRYTVDPSWKTPHFEKMLYDNAQLARLYLSAARVLQRDDYLEVARRTLDFMLRELAAPDGGFIAALSALDGEGVEGGYYLWSDTELDALLTPAERAVYRRHAGMIGAAPFEHGWLPLRIVPVVTLATQLKREPAEVERQLAAAESKLRAARAKRTLPRDTKVLAGWNGLALATLAEATRDTGDPRYREAGQRARDFLATRAWDGEQLARTRVDGKPGGKVALEDYAYVAYGLALWAELSGDERDYALAQAVARAGWQRFYGKRGWRLEETSLLVAETGQDVVSDGPLPSPSALLIEASLRLAARSGDTELRRQALSAANSGLGLIADNPFWHVTPVAALERAVEVSRARP